MYNYVDFGGYIMALGFRKSIFGYNCEEVSEYLHKKEYENKQTILSLNEKIGALKGEIQVTNETKEKLREEIKEITEQLNFYKSKYDEVKTLSENIGKLYLVAQTNAKSIMNSANETRIITEEEIKENLSLIDNTNISLKEIKDDLINMSNSFVEEIEKLSASLEQIKSFAQKSKEGAIKDTENFENIYSNIVK